MRASLLAEFKNTIDSDGIDKALLLLEQNNDITFHAMCASHLCYSNEYDLANEILIKLPKSIEFSGMRAKIAIEKKEYEKAFKYGSEYLKHLDQKVVSKNELETYHSLNPNGKNVISYSIFGNNPKYVETALLNLQRNKIKLPNWTNRFYISSDVPDHFTARAQALGAEILVVNDKGNSLNGTFWRFFVADDPTVNKYIVRDVDSYISDEEIILINEWLISDKPFHIIRDFVTHNGLIMAGLWGGTSGYLPNVQKLTYDYINSLKSRSRYDDQSFLAKVIWSYIRNHHLSHDFSFGYLSSSDLVLTKKHFDLDDKTHIGQCEAYFEVTVSIPKPLDIEFTMIITEGIDIICYYDMDLVQGSCTIILPNTYIENLDSGKFKLRSNTRKLVGYNLIPTFTKY